MWHVLHGPNTVARDEEVAKMRARVGDDAMADVNVIAFGPEAALADIQNAAETMPFFLEKKLVIVRNWLSKQGAPRKRKGEDGGALAKLIAYLPGLSDATALVFIEDGSLPENHPLLAAADGKAGRAKKFEVPANPGRWLVERAQALGGQLSPPAAEALANRINRGNKNDRDHFEDDSRLYLLKLVNELDKLLSYANGRRIETADVEALVAEEDVADIFKFVDAINARDGAEAYRTVRAILARGEHPLVVMSMTARQTRTLIQAKENERMSETDFAQLAGLHPFVARKALSQARGLEMDALVRAHLAVVEADAAVKSGRMEDVVALDALIATLCAG